MTTATGKLSFEDYLTYSDGTDRRYELVDGELVLMNLATGKHGSIIHFLSHQFAVAIAQTQHPWIALPGLVGVRSPRGRRWDTCRIPAITVMPLVQWRAMAEREAVIHLNEPPPLLVVEVISPATQSEDYRTKRAEYGLLEILEYWIVDPIASQVSIGVLDHEFYDLVVFRGDRVIESSVFPDLKLTVDQVLAAE